MLRLRFPRPTRRLDRDLPARRLRHADHELLDREVPGVDQLRLRIPRELEPQIPTERLGDRKPNLERRPTAFARLDLRQTRSTQIPTRSRERGLASVRRRLRASRTSRASVPSRPSRAMFAPLIARVGSFASGHVGQSDKTGLSEA